MNLAPVPRSTPSDSQTTSTSGAWPRKRPICGSASLRSIVWGCGLSCLTCTRAAPATAKEISRAGSDSGKTATPRSSASARAINSSAVRSRASQLAAAAQPSSIMSSSGTPRLDVASGGFHNGPAAAMMTSAASVKRSRTSHHGVRAGVSSLGAISNSRRVGGKLMRRGRGGTSRSSHHSTGRPSRPSSTSGCAKTSGKDGITLLSRLAWARGGWPTLVVCILAPMRECSTSSSSLAGRSVRWTAKVQPSRSVSLRMASRWRATSPW